MHCTFLFQQKSYYCSFVAVFAPRLKQNETTTKITAIRLRVLIRKINKNNQQGNLLLLHISDDDKMCARAFCIRFIIVCSSTFLCFVVNKEPPYAISSRRYNFCDSVINLPEHSQAT